jgi:hypothetical protein
VRTGAGREGATGSSNAVVARGVGRGGSAAAASSAAGSVIAMSNSGSRTSSARTAGRRVRGPGGGRGAGAGRSDGGARCGFGAAAARGRRMPCVGRDVVLSPAASSRSEASRTATRTASTKSWMSRSRPVWRGEERRGTLECASVSANRADSIAPTASTRGSVGARLGRAAWTPRRGVLDRVRAERLRQKTSVGRDCDREVALYVAGEPRRKEPP